MKLKKFCALLICLLTVCCLVACDAASVGRNITGIRLTQTTGKEDAMMTASEQEYNGLMNDLGSFPISFVYGDVYYGGFGTSFDVLTYDRVDTDKGICHNVALRLDETLVVTIKASYYRGYDAYDYTVYFSNDSVSENSKVLRYVRAIDTRVAGEKPVLKGILGDHGNQYAPYEYDLTERNVNFTSLSGRATHTYFPYFNLEHEDGGALFAIGWGGTWKADFVYDETSRQTRFTGEGTVGLATYLKPGEVVRTPLIAKVAYYERDEDAAMNKWRAWMVDCNLPRENAESGNVVQPVSANLLAYDTGRPNSDGSTSEGYDTWKRSMDAFYNNGMEMDYRWFDAGWYYSPYNKTVPSDWWGCVGTWELDKVKWPGDSFLESVRYAEERGTKTLAWFEPERVTHLAGMVQNYGYKREWVLATDGKNNKYLNNLGNKDCLNWTLNRIVSMMDKNGVHLYREDFNMDPAEFWSVGDGYEGKNRVGITENLYMQGHYALWDGIIAYCAENGKQTYIDSCASGGGRNDLETLRRAVPFLRSDSDRTTVSLRLAMTTRLVRWVPFTGAFAKESASQLAPGAMDIYVQRATYLPCIAYKGEWYHEQDTIDWASLRQGQREWNEVKKYFYKDFYVLTPQRSTTEQEEWTCYEYFDSENDSGVVQAFRPSNSSKSNMKVCIKGVNPNSYYTLRDLDGYNSRTKIKGSALLQGIPLVLSQPRSSLVLYVERWEG